ncbi:MAG: ABC transporter permease [Proteobacteria bacterium]|nr:ABC transporter permease [Pseudomonadota bacterium]
MGVIARVFEAVGRSVLEPIEEVGRVSKVFAFGFANVFMRPLRIRETLKQMEFIGVQSLPIILLTSFFTGAVFTLQSHRAFAMFGAQAMVGGTVGVALTRELAPTLTGLLVAGRAGSAIAAEIGSMRVSEQIDALDAMAVDPINYLIKPRLLAAIIVTPMLTAIYDFVGMFGSWYIAMYVLNMSEPEYMKRTQEWIDWDDIWSGLLKALVFGAIIGTVACYKGYYTKGGAAGVGQATTSAVVVASVAILVSNFFIAWALP